MKRIITAAALLAVVFGALTITGGRTLMERRIYYMNKGKVTEAKYWSLYVGTYECPLRRKFPGEDTITVNANMNVSIISSGYVEATGYCERGRVDGLFALALDNGTATTQIHLDSIAYVSRDGQKVVHLNGQSGTLKLDIEGKYYPIKHLQFRPYQMTKQFDEEVLKALDEVRIPAFSFTKDGLARANKDGAALE